MANTSDPENILSQARRALQSVPGIDLQEHPVNLAYEDGALTLEGDVDGIAAKKLALEAAAAISGLEGIVDRLHVVPAQAMGDQEIRDHLRDVLLSEPAFLETGIREEAGSRARAAAGQGEIAFAVADGVVTLSGELPGLVQKRLAGVLAWWVPGVRDVVNGVAVTPPEPESEAGITDAVRIALEKDPFVNDAQIGVHTHGTTVVLSGLVPTDSEREMAEADAWYVFGVDKVVNRIDVRPIRPGS